MKEQVFIYRGVRYGPGFKKPTKDVLAAIEGTGKPKETTKVSSELDEALPANFPMAETLQEAGFTNMAEVAEASDEELMEVPGIGEGRLREIREFLDENYRG